MDSQEKEGNTLKDEFRNLGNNLKDVLDSAWGSEERKKLQQDIEGGMKELGTVLEGWADTVKSGEAGQTIRKEVDDIGDRIRSGEVEEKTRDGIMNALKTLNAELEKARDKFSKPTQEDE